MKRIEMALKHFGNGSRSCLISYRVEIDITSLLNAKLMNRLQQLTGILRWAIELDIFK